MHRDLEEKIQKLSLAADIAENNEPYLEAIEALLLRELEKEPKNAELWIRLAMLEYTVPWEDPDRIISYIQNILSYSPYHPEALLVLAYIEKLFLINIKKETFNRLLHVCDVSNDIMGMIELAKAWYYEDKDKDLYEKFLIKSIEYAPYFLSNYVELGKSYFKRGDYKKGSSFIRKGLGNLKGIYFENAFKKNDLTDIQDFFDEFYRKIYRTRPNYDRDKKWLTVKNPVDTIKIV